MRVSTGLALIFAAGVAGCANQPPLCPSSTGYPHTQNVGETLRRAEKTGEFQGSRPTSSLGGSKSGFTTRSTDQSCAL